MMLCAFTQVMLCLTLCSWGDTSAGGDHSLRSWRQVAELPAHTGTESSAADALQPAAQHDNSCDASGEATASKAAVPWMEDARQYLRVEQWFHSLVKTYFKGSLKVDPPSLSPTLQLANLSCT